MSAPWIRGLGPGFIGPEAGRGCARPTIIGPMAKHQLWLQLLEGSFKLIHKDQGDGHLTAGGRWREHISEKDEAAN
jgi:hypothetical protein